MNWSHLTEHAPNMQVVNALLTQLDKLKHKKNVLVMATSNLPQAIGSFIKEPNRSIFPILTSISNL